MRYIDRSGYTPSDVWKAKAAVRLAELEAKVSDKDKSDYLESTRGKIWGDLKDDLLELSNQKCWYSEARCDYSYFHVDHFRPKGRVKEKDKSERDGYWWLAYDWKNYRVAGGAGNSPKQSSFKLVEGCSPALKDGPPFLADEVALLLDPCRQGDPSLLSFGPDGKAVPTGGLNPQQEARVRYTVQTLNLDFPQLRIARKEVWDKCQKLADEYEALDPPPGSASPTTQAEVDRIQAAFRELILRSTPYSSTARHFLQKCGIRELAQILTT